MPTIAVVGAGFCGTIITAELLKTAFPTPVNLVLINRSGLLARGVAYGTRSDDHVLNVPAGRMSARPDDEEDFLRFAQSRDPRHEASSFVPRRVFGDYLESQLVHAARSATHGNQLSARVGEVTAIHQQPGDGPVRLQLDNGDTLMVDRVLLALGNFPPANLPLQGDASTFFRSPRYIRDPWAADALWAARSHEPVLLIGSGLTMLDVVLSLRRRGVTGPITAMSRRGLVPLGHRDNDQPPRYRSQIAGQMLERPAVRHWLRLLREDVARAAAEDTDWRDIIGALRSATPQLWKVLPDKERRRFLRHLRPYWEVHRHRCAPQLAEIMRGEIDNGGLRVVAGRLHRFDEGADDVRVSWRPRGSRELVTTTVSTVINCTGPAGDLRRLGDPLITQLRDAGWLTPDAFGTGLLVDDHYRLLDLYGRPQKNLYYVGPLLRAQHWEATAVPELRHHVRRAITALLESFSQNARIEPSAARQAGG